MNTARNLGRRLLLRLLLVGVTTGFLGGYLGEKVLLRYGYHLPVEHIGPLFGVVLGLFIGFFTNAIARRMVLTYIHSLHEELGELGDIRPGLRQDLSLDDEASALYDLVDYEVSVLADDRQKLRKLVQEARETLDRCNLSEFDDLGDYEQLIDDRVHELQKIAEETAEFKDWFETSVKPIFSGQMDSFSFNGLEKFDGMVQFQKDIEGELEETKQTVRDLKQVIQPWKQGPGRLKEAIGRANEVIGEASKLFEQFPHEDLPEKTEKLRRATEEWNELARQIEQGVQRLSKASNQAETTISALQEQAEKATGPESVWNDIKENHKRADNKIDRLKDVVDDRWIESLEKQLESLKSQATWLTQTTQELKEELKKERNQVETLNDLMDTLADVVEKPDND